jgi:hypothetical protein
VHWGSMQKWAEGAHFRRTPSGQAPRRRVQKWIAPVHIRPSGQADSGGDAGLGWAEVLEALIMFSRRCRITVESSTAGGLQGFEFAGAGGIPTGPGCPWRRAVGRIV